MAEDSTNIRIAKATNEALKKHADLLGLSAAELADRALRELFAMMGGDDRLPLLVAEYRLKKAYSEGAGPSIAAAAPAAIKAGAVAAELVKRKRAGMKPIRVSR